VHVLSTARTRSLLYTADKSYQESAIFAHHFLPTHVPSAYVIVCRLYSVVVELFMYTAVDCERARTCMCTYVHVYIPHTR